MDAIAIREALRNGDSEDLDRRRKIILLSTLALCDFGFIALYQTGVIKKLPDIPLPIFDSNKVNGSKDSYQMGTPDATIATLNHAMNIVLSAAGGNEAASRKPGFDVALGAVVLGNAAGAVRFMMNMITKQKKICIYCTAGAIINFTSAVIIAPVVIKSLRRLFNPQRVIPADSGLRPVLHENDGLAQTKTIESELVVRGT
jgi:uncharacterized membrane protein